MGMLALSQPGEVPQTLSTPERPGKGLFLAVKTTDSVRVHTYLLERW